MIERARGSRDPKAASLEPASLKQTLAPLPDQEIRDFAVHFNTAQVKLNHWDIWAAGYVLNGGMGDDSFHYFRSWIIGKGKAAFDAALTDPDSLSTFVAAQEDLDNELLEYVAVELMEARNQPDPRDEATEFPDDDPQGEPFDEDTVGDRFPLCVEVAKRLGNWN